MNRDLEFNLHVNKTHVNKTFNYILPMMNIWDTFKFFESNVNIAGVAIGDCIHDCAYMENEFLYLAINISNRSNIKYGEILNSDYDLRNFLLILEEARHTPWYVQDYPILHDGTIDQFHMVVCKLPPEIRGVKKKFCQGKYSELYPKELIKNNIRRTYKKDNIEHMTLPYLVLTKDARYREVFSQLLKKDFGTDVEVDENFELEYPPVLKNEVINMDYCLINLEDTDEYDL